MKIAVTSTGKSLDSPVDPRFGRAAWFILADTETGKHCAIENAAGLDAPQGAGVMAAQTLSSFGAEVVLTGECGPRAADALRKAGIQLRADAKGSVAQAIEDFKAQKFPGSSH